MLDRYPNQTRARRGLALVGGIFLLFGLLMALWGSTIGAWIGAVWGLALLLPAVFCGAVGFQKYERLLSRLALWGSC